MAYDEDLADLMRDALADRRGIEEKRMFGGLCWTVQGNMLCGISERRFMFRVGVDRTGEALARPGAAPMDFTGRPMRGLVWVDAQSALATGLDNWIGFAGEFVDTLPGK